MSRLHRCRPRNSRDLEIRIGFETDRSGRHRPSSIVTLRGRLKHLPVHIGLDEDVVVAGDALGQRDGELTCVGRIDGQRTDMGDVVQRRIVGAQQGVGR